MNKAIEQMLGKYRIATILFNKCIYILYRFKRRELGERLGGKI